MLLRDWRKSKGYTQLTLGRALGVHQTTIASWEAGAKVPGRTLMAKLRKLSEGQVTADDFYPDDQARQVAA